MEKYNNCHVEINAVMNNGSLKSKRKAISKDMRFAVYEKYNGHCAYCGSQIEYKDMQVDHVVSVYWYGGANEFSNYMPACRACNFYKSSMTLEKFREQLQTLTDRLKKTFIYNLALKYGLLKESNKPVKFYFEKVDGSSTGGVNETNII